MKLYLVRHGQTERNRDRRVQGRGNHGLTELGRQQAKVAGKALFRADIAALYSSTLWRAEESASIIGRKLNLPVTLAEELAELDTGEMEGLTSGEMRERYPEVMSRWDVDPGTAQLPGGESLHQVQTRAWKWVERIAAAHAGEHVAAVSHNFTIHSIVCKALDVPLASFRRLQIDLGSTSAIEVLPDRVRVVLLNNTPLSIGA